MEAKDYIQRLNELSTKKLALLDELLLFSRSQKEALEAENYDDMDALINEKQLRMDGIDKIDEQFLIYASRLKSVLSLSSFEELPRYNLPGSSDLKELVIRIHERLGQLKELEDGNIAKVKSEMKESQEKINHSNSFKRVTGAYYPVQNDIPAYYFDKKK